MRGEKISLHEWLGHPVILRFWSTDCIYCRADTPIFNEYFNKFKDRGLRVVYLNSGASQGEVARFVSDLAIPFPVVMDKAGAVAALYRVKIVPQTIIIDPDQKITAAVPGGVGEAELQKLLGKYFDGGGKR
ncbi:MAG: TlpA family protein disulfide reductase [Proteobacteria bacterium]|nr:TlpA family protein disulfide reductase [Pseudomonadota bacterium]MBU4294275.1 TlpA family protein disulfide reductase [Pseudomonadota bacterium]MCG2747432.1 TlpA family protein disulfide reductase [Desulfobulbaceae bacterium]